MTQFISRDSFVFMSEEESRCELCQRRYNLFRRKVRRAIRLN